MRVANTDQETKRKALWFERLLLLLDPKKTYSTGDILDEWSESEDVSVAMKKKLEAKRGNVQSALSRYLESRLRVIEKYPREFDCSMAEVAEVFKPVSTKLYGPTRRSQHIFLGAQYAWAAANHMGVDHPRTISEVLRLVQEHLKENVVEGEAEGRESEACQVVPPKVETETIRDHAIKETEQGRAEQVKKRPHFSFKWSLPATAIVLSLISVLGTVGLAGTFFYSNNQAKLETLTKVYNTGGLSAVREKASTLQKAESKADIYGLGYLAAHDPQKSIDAVEEILKPLLDDENLGWQAKANLTMGVAYLNRGELYRALDCLGEAESKLIGVSRQKRDLKAVYLDMAECYFYLNDPDQLIERVKLARMIGVRFREATCFHYESRYWFLKGEIEKAIESCLEALKLAKTTEEVSFTAYYHGNLGLLYSINGSNESAYYQLKKAQIAAVKTDNHLLLTVLHDYESFWAEKAGLPFASSYSSYSDKLFSAQKKYIEFILEVAHGNSNN